MKNVELTSEQEDCLLEEARERDFENKKSKFQKEIEDQQKRLEQIYGELK